ncbi:MAG: YaiI/YqxD family protein [Burkholderiales bacterium]|nr:YaiI/YqxD family protein [Burkholderiales bacterium]
MQIWVDADACPKEIKQVLYRAAERVGVQVTFVANQHLLVPRSRWISALQVESGFDKADAEIVRRVSPGDLVITSDIALAAQVLNLGGKALGARGEWFTEEDIAARLTMRDFLDNLRGSGIMSGGPPAMNQQDRQSFSNHLDRFLRNYQSC